MKKFIATILFFVMVFTLVSCGKKSNAERTTRDPSAATENPINPFFPWQTAETLPTEATVNTETAAATEETSEPPSQTSEETTTQSTTQKTTEATSASTYTEASTVAQEQTTISVTEVIITDPTAYPAASPDTYFRFTLSADGQSYSVRAESTRLSGNIVIPKTYNGKPVTAVSEAVYNASDRSYSGGFAECNNITSITMPSTIESIGNYAFYNCRSLKTAAIPVGVTYIGERAFFNCIKIESISIPRGVSYIGQYAFSGCSAVSSIRADSRNSAYHSADNCLIETASKTLVLGCKNSVIPSDGSVTSIGEGAFFNCSDLSKINLPKAITQIGVRAFYGCVDIENIVLPSNLSVIGIYAFSYCAGLTNVSLPLGLIYIGSGAFSNCPNLVNITYEGTVSQWNAVSKDSNWISNSGTSTVRCSDGNSTHLY